MALEMQQHDLLLALATVLPIRGVQFSIPSSHLPFLLEVPQTLKAMSRNGKSPRLDLKLNVSPPPRRANMIRMESPNRSMSISPSPSLTSPPSSCVSSELNLSETDQGQTHGHSNSPEATSMVLVGCPRCLMYVMLSEEDPRCPQCKSTVLLDFLQENNNNNNNNNNSNSNNNKKPM